MWDRISAVFQFHRDEKKLALYSQLHEWALEDSEKEKLIDPKPNGVNNIEMTAMTEEV